MEIFRVASVCSLGVLMLGPTPAVKVSAIALRMLGIRRSMSSTTAACEGTVSSMRWVGVSAVGDCDRREGGEEETRGSARRMLLSRATRCSK